MADDHPVFRCYPNKVSTPIRGADIRVLVALEDDYRAYREMIATTLRFLRPEAKVESAALERLEEDLGRFDPQVVICNGHKDLEPDGSRAWIELSMNPTLPAKISVGGRYFELTNPSVEALLEVIDEVRVTPHRYVALKVQTAPGSHSAPC